MGKYAQNAKELLPLVDGKENVAAVSGIEGVSKDAVKAASKQNQNVLQRIITAMAEIFAPLIPAIITGGLILGFRNCIDSLYLFENGTKMLCDISQFWQLLPQFWKIGLVISSVVYAGITGSFKILFGTLFGFVYAPLVITGLHHMSNAIDLQLIADYEGTMLCQ